MAVRHKVKITTQYSGKRWAYVITQGNDLYVSRYKYRSEATAYQAGLIDARSCLMLTLPADEVEEWLEGLNDD